MPKTEEWDRDDRNEPGVEDEDLEEDFDDEDPEDDEDF